MMLRSFTDSMLFYPARGQWRTPAALGLTHEEVWIESRGDRIQGWWLPGSADGVVIVMFHGNAGTIADRLENARLMIERLGATVFLVEYPGYGDSEGRPSERSLFGAGEAAVAEARRRAGDRPMIAFGRSLGGAVAVHLASNDATASMVDALIVESSFTSLAGLARALGFPVAAPMLPYRFDSLSVIGRVEVPTLILHGDRDEVVPYEMGERLYSALSSEIVKRWYRIDGAGHNDSLLVGGPAYWRQWIDFLRNDVGAPVGRGARGEEG